MIQNEESYETWSLFFDYLKTRGLDGVEMVSSDAHKGLVRAIKKSFTTASWQRCHVHFMRNILSCIPKKKSKPFRENLNVLFKFPDIKTARKTKNSLESEYINQLKYQKACEKLNEEFEDAFQYAVVGKGQSRLKSTNLLERLMKKSGAEKKLSGFFQFTPLPIV